MLLKYTPLYVFQFTAKFPPDKYFIPIQALCHNLKVSAISNITYGRS
jgi:hypothetical protein